MGWNRYKLASWFCIASLLTPLGQAAASERQPEEPFTPLQQNIETLRQEHQIPGASIAVIDDGQIAWARGFGLADLASGSGQRSTGHGRHPVSGPVDHQDPHSPGHGEAPCRRGDRSG